MIGMDTEYYTKEDVFAGIKEDKAASLDIPVWFNINDWDFVKLAYQYINGAVSNDELLAQITERYNQISKVHKSRNISTMNIDSVMHYVNLQEQAFHEKEQLNTAEGTTEDSTNTEVPKQPILYQFGANSKKVGMIPVSSKMTYGVVEEDCSSHLRTEEDDSNKLRLVCPATHVAMPLDDMQNYFSMEDGKLAKYLDFEGIRDEEGVYFKRISITQICLNTKALSSYHYGSMFVMPEIGVFYCVEPDENGIIFMNNIDHVFLEFSLYTELINSGIIKTQ